MQWPFKTTIRYDRTETTVRVQYAVCADNFREAQQQLIRRLGEKEGAGFVIEQVEAVTGREAAQLNLPDGGMVLLA
jgi:hypothetical protein